MSLLQPAYSEQIALKLGAQGDQGSGKTYTLSAMAIGLSKRYHESKPVAFFDTEKQSDFVMDMFRTEGVPLVVLKSKSFIDMRDAFTEAESSCCAFIADSYTHPSIELHQAFKEKLNLLGRRTQYHHNDHPSLLWDAWTEQWKASALHCLFAARLGFKWGDVFDEQGDVQHVKLDTKMKGSDGGYEPNLVIEFESIDDPELRHVKTRGKQGINTHWLRIRKDRCQALNGRSFPFKDCNGYRAGDYIKILAAIQPHLDKLCIGRGLVRPEAPRRSSQELFQAPTGESAFAERAKRINKAWGEVEGTINTLWPGQTTEEKRLKLIVRKMLFGVRSDAAILALLPEQLETAELAMRHFEEAATDEQQKVNVRVESQVVDLLTSCLQLEKTRLEAMSF